MSSLDQQMVEHARTKQQKKKQQDQMNLEIAKLEHQDDKVQVLMKSQQETQQRRTSKLMQKLFRVARMPSFAIFSRLDKQLLKTMLVRATEIADEEVYGLRIEYFNAPGRE